MAYASHEEIGSLCHVEGKVARRLPGHRTSAGTSSWEPGKVPVFVSCRRPVAPHAVSFASWYANPTMSVDEPSSKRTLTQDARTASGASFQTSANDLVSADLTARLQNVGSRIRRSVSEGYATHRFSPASMQGQTARSTSINGPPIFRSSNDTLHAVYSQFPPPSRSSANKRGRVEPVDEDDEYPDGIQTGVDDKGDDAQMQSTSVITASDLASSRPIKPLRRTPRTFGQTKSLPAAVFAATAGSADLHVPGADFQEEDDWSIAAFSGDPSKDQTLSTPTMES